MIVIGFLGLQLLKNDWLETSFLALLPTNEQQRKSKAPSNNIIN